MLMSAIDLEELTVSIYIVEVTLKIKAVYFSDTFGKNIPFYTASDIRRLIS
jgi:hypothetical protein